MGELERGEMTTGGPVIALDRLRQDLLTLAEIGRNEDDRGVYRLAFTEADMQARRWLLGRIEEAGGRARLDEAGNVIGRWFDDIDAPAGILEWNIDNGHSCPHNGADRFRR